MRTYLRSVVYFSLAFVIPSSLCLAATLHVPGEYPTIQDAVDAASLGDTVLVADGTYTGIGFFAISFGGKDITVRSEHGPECTILSMDTDRPTCFLFCNGETEEAVVEGFTITGARVFGHGAGIFIHSSSPTITNCLIAGNRVVGNHVGYGGGIACIDGSPTIIGCTISSNVAICDLGPCGGGFHCLQSSPTLIRTILWGNYDGDLVTHDQNSVVTLICCAVDPEGITGPGQVEFMGESVLEDPLFCNPQPAGLFVADPLDYCLWIDSPCLPWNSPCGELIGALGLGCPVAPVPYPEGSGHFPANEIHLGIPLPNPTTGSLSYSLHLRGGKRARVSESTASDYGDAEACSSGGVFCAAPDQPRAVWF